MPLMACFFSFSLNAQMLDDSLIIKEIPSFEESFQVHTTDPEKLMVDTLLAKIIPTVDIETVEDRISCLQLDMPIVVNKTVCGFINFFTVRKRNYTQTMLERKNYYFPIFEYYLKKHEMPDALKYLSIVESGLNFKAVSRTGAVGLWQFMPGTGKDFYLTQNAMIDERQHPYLATEAACKFLKYLYRTFGDWELALAAYNCGPGNVSKAIKKSGKRGFWEIYPFLPQETRSYVPQFHAVVYAMNFAGEHLIFPDVDSILVAPPLDTFKIDKTFDLFKLEAILGLPVNSLRHHNPLLRTHVFPGHPDFHFMVPTTHSSLLAANLNQFIDSAKVTSFPAMGVQKKGGNESWTFYQAKKGESIQDIARRFSVSAREIQKWNHLKSNNLAHNHRLKIKHLPVQELETAKVEVPQKGEHWLSKTHQSEFHIVEKGERLYQVGVRYGKTTEELKRYNGLTSNHVREGQRLWLVAGKQPEWLAEWSDSNNTIPVNKSAFHTVSVGEGLYSISKTHGCTISQIKEWNNLKTDEIREGQVISLFPNDLVATEALESDSIKEQNGMEARVIAKSTSKARPLVKKSNMDLARVYHVQKGDTLYSITRKFTRLTVKDLIRINKLKDKNIKPGQQLIIG